ncbi:MAG: hypothetical protein VCB59_08695 [Gammaproteobacteria bacterium]
MKKNYKPTVAGLGSTIILAASIPVSAANNPFEIIEFGAPSMLAGEARDSQGNKVVINDETDFEYGGDQMGKYSDGKVGTGIKDPSVCGSFSESSCSMPHTAADE